MEKKIVSKRYFKRKLFTGPSSVVFKQHHLATVSLVVLAVLVVAALLAPDYRTVQSG